ncbi:MAG TPA: hypothetical protein VMU45_13055, partial [Candidatus Eisenbacteria bacterium]|nr:hypothetical protein [Candidatus Eisenbacteria bacterium]
TGAGTISGTRLISTVATGTAPLQVASTTQVPNLNASLLGGNAASGFALASGVVSSFNGRADAVLPAPGDYNFSQLTGTVGSAQLGGSYANPLTFSNTSNVYFGNGSGLTGVSSGLSWPVVLKSADYAIQASDFATATTYGNYLMLTGSAAHTFTLPNPAPPSGNCVAIGNNAAAPIGSNLNVFLTVNGNGLTIDGSSPSASQPRRNAYLYCSDGTSYWRLNRQLPGVSEIGPPLYTTDTGTVNAMKTTFVAGIDFGLIAGTTMFLLPINANTSPTPTLNVNGLGAKTIVRFGNQPLLPGDFSASALALVIYDGNNWQLINPQTMAGTVTSVTATPPLVSSGGATPNISCPACNAAIVLSGTTTSIGGFALAAGDCTSGTASVVGAVVGHPVSVSASDGSLPNGFIILSAAVTSANTVTVQLCATGDVTPPTNTYNVMTQ